jgi:hypothetical protein
MPDPELPVLAKLRSQIKTPVENIGGPWDWAVPPSNHRYVHERRADRARTSPPTRSTRR